MKRITIEEAFDDLKTADLKVKRKHRYPCGLNDSVEKKRDDKENECIRVYINSPDYQKEVYILKNMKRITIEEAFDDLKTADLKVKRKHRYPCGLGGSFERKDGKENEWIRVSFNSPDYQNAELFFALIDLGWSKSMYEAPYFWTTRKRGVYIHYLPGKVYIAKKKEKN